MRIYLLPPSDGVGIIDLSLNSNTKVTYSSNRNMIYASEYIYNMEYGNYLETVSISRTSAGWRVSLDNVDFNAPAPVRSFTSYGGKWYGYPWFVSANLKFINANTATVDIQAFTRHSTVGDTGPIKVTFNNYGYATFKYREHGKTGVAGTGSLSLINGTVTLDLSQGEVFLESVIPMKR
jgi:hypothetical protein